MTRSTVLVLVAMACGGTAFTPDGGFVRPSYPVMGTIVLVDGEDDTSMLYLDGPYVEELAGSDGTCWKPVMSPGIRVHMPSLATLPPGEYNLVPVTVEHR